MAPEICFTINWKTFCPVALNLFVTEHSSTCHCIHVPTQFSEFANKIGLQKKMYGSHSGDYEDYNLLGCHAVYLNRILSMFRRKVSPPSSGSKIKLNKYAAKTKREAYSACLHVLIFKLEDRYITFFRNVGKSLADYTVLRYRLFYFEV
jgi:hypothetical protein